MLTRLALAAFVLILPTPGESQDRSSTTGAVPPAAIVPAPPLAPAVIARDSQGRVTVRATQLSEPLVIDGRLDEPVYASVQSFGDFIQQEPHEGQPPTDKTDGWVFYDNKNVYISLRVWYSHPETIIANEMRRDAGPVWSTNDSINVVLDTFHDHRSGYYLNTNALGAVRDGLLTNEERNANMDFNMVWDVRSRRFEQGWTTEMVIPFKSLRYPAGRQQVWGFQIQRLDRSKNESSYLTPIPLSYGLSGVWRVSAAATLVGIEAPPGGGNFELKPYALSSVSSDRQVSPPLSNDLSKAFGFDARYKITKSVNADFTYNTDFAQVEVDNQQVNLSRFSLFFPEKREFFLEGQTTFNFGGPGAIIFFSRRVGLTSEGVPVPIQAGGRLLGRVGPYTVGVMSIKTKESAAVQAPATTFSAVRVRRDVLSRSSIGMIATDRSPSAAGGGSNQVFGVDASLALFQNVAANAYYARSQTRRPSGSGSDDAESYHGEIGYNDDRYGALIDHMKVGSSFNPEIGFLFRPAGYVRNFAYGRFSPRPARLPGVRKVSWEASLENFASTTGVPQTRALFGIFRVIQNSGDEFRVSHVQTEDRPQSAFRVAGAPIAAGSYDFGQTAVNYVLGPQRPLTGFLSVNRGSFYGGRKTELSYNGRVSPTSQFIVEPIITLNWLHMPQGEFRSRLVSARTTYTMTPRMFVAALIQYNSSGNQLGTNIRFRWEYEPGSDLFVVYNDGRDTLGRGFPTLLNRSFSIKFTHLFRS